MKLESISRMKNIDSGLRKTRTAASKRVARFRRPRLRFEQLEDRSLLSAPGDIEWLRQFGGFAPGQFDVGRAVDADGNIYMAGNVRGALPGQTYTGFEDDYLRKKAGAANQISTHEFGYDS